MSRSVLWFRHGLRLKEQKFKFKILLKNYFFHKDYTIIQHCWKQLKVNKEKMSLSIRFSFLTDAQQVK